jgi:hypothetical protein
VAADAIMSRRKLTRTPLIRSKTAVKWSEVFSKRVGTAWGLFGLLNVAGAIVDAFRRHSADFILPGMVIGGMAFSCDGSDRLGMVSRRRHHLARSVTIRHADCVFHDRLTTSAGVRLVDPECVPTMWRALLWSRTVSRSILVLALSTLRVTDE